MHRARCPPTRMNLKELHPLFINEESRCDYYEYKVQEDPYV